MRQENKNFYNDVVKKPAYWLLVLIFAIAAYGFNLFNRTSSFDFFDVTYYNNANLGDRWGMPVFGKILGLYDINPPIDKFLALLFLILSGVGVSFLFYRIRNEKDCMLINRNQNNKCYVFGYAILTIILITYPLINTIWEYYYANCFYAGGLLAGILAICVMNVQCLNRYWRFLIASALMVMPITTYEASVASYITIVSLLVFYENVLLSDKKLSFKKWFVIMWPYAIPVIIAIIARIIVTVIFCNGLGIQHINIGNSSINWFSLGLFSSLRGMVAGYFFDWVLKALVYFPITEFIIAFALFVVMMIALSFKRRSFKPFLLGLVVLLSVFSLSILQGSSLNYRTAQPVAIIVAFVIFIVGNKMLLCRNSVLKHLSIGLLFLLGWHQATYLNQLLVLDNLRSDNEAAKIQQIGMRLLSEYDKKPVVFVSSISLSHWINQRICPDTTTWNGRIYNFCINKFYKSASSLVKEKYIGTNVTNYTNAYFDLQDAFSYYGYDIDVIGPTAYPYAPNHKKPHPLLDEATKIARENKMKPYEIMDHGDYIIVQLSGESYYVDDYVMQY